MVFVEHILYPLYPTGPLWGLARCKTQAVFSQCPRDSPAPEEGRDTGSFNSCLQVLGADVQFNLRLAGSPGTAQMRTGRWSFRACRFQADSKY